MISIILIYTYYIKHAAMFCIFLGFGGVVIWLDKITKYKIKTLNKLTNLYSEYVLYLALSMKTFYFKNKKINIIITALKILLFLVPFWFVHVVWFLFNRRNIKSYLKKQIIND